MNRPLLAAAFSVLALPALAQQPINLLPPREPAPATLTAPIVDKPPVEEPAPNFEPLRPAPPEPEQPAAPAQATPPAAPEPAPAPVPVAPPVVAPPVVVPPAPEPAPVAAAAAPAAEPSTAAIWTPAVLVLLGAMLASLFGLLAGSQARRGEQRARRRAVAATLATELETRRLAFDSVPLPPNVEAGVSFVSSVTSLAGIDAGFRSAMFDIHLLPEKLASHVTVHYAAVQRVADFVKGQSLAAAVRMLQANRIGGHPCPDAGTMREAHVELTAAFRGTDKLISALRGLS